MNKDKYSKRRVFQVYDIITGELATSRVFNRFSTVKVIYSSGLIKYMYLQEFAQQFNKVIWNE